MHSAESTPTALLLIDIQRGFNHPTHWGSEWSTPSFSSNIEKILGATRAYNEHAVSNQVHIFHVHHHSLSATSMLHPSHSDPEAAPSGLYIDPAPHATPDPKSKFEHTMVKHRNSAFVGTDLEKQLRANNIRQLIITGLTTDHCVSTSTRMAANLQVLGNQNGPDGTGDNHHGVIVVSDGTATYDKGGIDAETVHKVNLASLDGEFARVEKTQEILRRVFGV